MTSSITFPDGADFKLLPRIMSPTGPGQPESVAERGGDARVRRTAPT